LQQEQAKYIILNYWLTPNASQPDAVARVQVMGCVPFSLEMNLPLLPLKVTLPSVVGT
jgi:hypothetical protein